MSSIGTALYVAPKLRSDIGVDEEGSRSARLKHTAPTIQFIETSTHQQAPALRVERPPAVEDTFITTLVHQERPFVDSAIE